MKKAFVIGMVLVSAVTAQSAFAGGAVAAKPVMERLTDYSKESKKHTFGSAMSAKSLSGKELDTARQKVISQLAVGGLKMELANALSGESAAVKARMDTLVTMVAAKRMAADIKTEKPDEASSIDRSISAQVEFIANAELIAKQPTGDNVLVSEALTKLTETGGDIITKFNITERDSYTKILEKTNELSFKSESLNEAFVQAIMDVKGIDRTKALEIVKKLKECV